MRHREGGGGVGLPRFDQGDELVVLVGGNFALFGKGGLARVVEGHADPRVVDQQATQAGHEVFVVGHLSDDRMEAFVPKRPLGRVAVLDGLPEGPLAFLETRDLVGRGVFGGEPRRRRIDHRGNHEEVAQGLVRHRRHLGTAVLVQDDIAFACKLAQHLAQRRTGNSVGIRQLRLVEVHARLQRFGQNLAAQVFDAPGLLAAGFGFHGVSPA